MRAVVIASALIALGLGLSGCAVAEVGGAVIGAGATVVGAGVSVVGTAVDVTGDVVGAGVGAVTGGDDDKKKSKD